MKKFWYEKKSTMIFGEVCKCGLASSVGVQVWVSFNCAQADITLFSTQAEVCTTDRKREAVARSPIVIRSRTWCTLSRACSCQTDTVSVDWTRL